MVDQSVISVDLEDEYEFDCPVLPGKASIQIVHINSIEHYTFPNGSAHTGLNTQPVFVCLNGLKCKAYDSSAKTIKETECAGIHDYKN